MKKKHSNKPELLAPAGNLKKLKFAFAYGADAVYCGVPDFSLRAQVNDFNLENLRQGIDYAHDLGKKIYVTINIYPHKKHLEKLPEYLEKLKTVKPDALIVSDPGILCLVKETCPQVEIHLSTQANCTNWQAAKFWHEAGVKRIILARETTLEDIKQIHDKVPQVELECFVHGAMCMSYSGRCLLSKWFTDRSANLGECTQPCRWEYRVAIEEDHRPGCFFPVEEDQHGTYIMNSKDLCLIEHLKELAEAGIVSFKIEGRTKSIYYVGNTVNVYRQAIDGDTNTRRLMAELKKSQNRGFTTGFFFGRDKVEERFSSSHAKCEWEFCGEVLEKVNQGVKRSLNKLHSINSNYRLFQIKVHNQVFVGDEIEFVVPGGEVINCKIEKMFNKDFLERKQAHGGQDDIIYLPLEKEVEKMTLVRRKLK